MIILKSSINKTVKTVICIVSLCLLFGFNALAANVHTPEASGTVTYGNNKAVIDASHASDGYLMIKYTGTNPKIKLRITKNTVYTYNLNSSGQYETFPLTEGSGTYTIKLFELVSGSEYMQALSESVAVTISSDALPFLYPNQFCNFNADSAVVAKANDITAGISDPLKKVEAVYNYAVDNITYDTEKALSVQSDYLPNPDSTLSQKTGICFDYAALMTSMLRSQDVPTKLVIGYAGDVYHAWVSIYIQSQGWIDNVIYFDGASWKFMDPTFVSSGKRSQAALDYVSNPGHYVAKFTY